MKPISFCLLTLAILVGCKREEPPQPNGPHPVGEPAGGGGVPGGAGVRAPASDDSLVAARRGFVSKLVPQVGDRDAVTVPPANIFRPVRYKSPAGDLAAYLSVDPKDGKKHPAIVWITGGDCNSIDEGCWKEGPKANDQSAAAYRKAGIIMMFPSLRGGNNNPGNKEGFLGEVDDVIAAAEHLAKQEYVDPDRIYLGGHSTGGTLALLVSECSDRFRAVFSFGPVDDVAGYDEEYTPFDRRNPREVKLRSPAYWLAGIKRPTFVLEGTTQGNIGSLRAMSQATANRNAHFLPVRGGNHFSILWPVNRLIAQKILKDDGPTCNLTLTENEVNQAMVK